MIEDFALVGGVLLKYGIALFFIVFSIGLLSSFLTSLRREPGTVAKLIFVTLAPLTLALSIPYFILHQEFGAPLWLNVIAGFLIHALSTGFLEKRVNVRFKDEGTK